MHTLIEAPDGLYLYSDLTKIAFHPLDFNEYYQSLKDLSIIGQQLVTQFSLTEINTLITMPNSFFDIEQYRKVRSVHKFGSFNFASFFSKRNVEYDLGKEDNLIVQSIEYIESMEKEVEKEVKGLGEIYTIHSCIAEVIWAINKYGKKIEEFIESVYVDKEVCGDVEKYAKEYLMRNIGKDEFFKLISHPALTSIPRICVSLSESIINKRIILASLYEYLKCKLEQISPNLLSLLGSRVAAELISKAGSLSALSKCPSSTLQLLGAEKALFRALKNKTNTPKHGVLYRHGRLARTVACKASIAARIDCYSVNRTNEYGLEMRKLIEQKELGIKTENTDAVLKRVYEKLKGIEKSKKEGVDEKENSSGKKKLKMSGSNSGRRDKEVVSIKNTNIDANSSNKKEISIEKKTDTKKTKDGKKDKTSDKDLILNGDSIKDKEKTSKRNSKIEKEATFSKKSNNNKDFSKMNNLSHKKDLSSSKKRIVDKECAEEKKKRKSDKSIDELESKKKFSVDSLKNKQDVKIEEKRNKSLSLDGGKKKSKHEAPLNSEDTIKVDGTEFKLLNRSKLNDKNHDSINSPKKMKNKTSKNLERFSVDHANDLSTSNFKNFPSSSNSNIFSTPTLIMDSSAEKIDHAESKSKGKNKKSAPDSNQESLNSSVSNQKRKAAVTRVVTIESEKKKMDADAKKATKKTRVKKEDKEKKTVEKKKDEKKKDEKKKDKVKEKEKKTSVGESNKKMKDKKKEDKDEKSEKKKSKKVVPEVKESSEKKRKDGDKGKSKKKVKKN